MPTYEFRCIDCGEVTAIVRSLANKPQTTICKSCAGTNTRSIISKPNVVLSSQSKLERLDPKYDKMVDQAMSKNPSADPDNLLRKMRDPTSGKRDD